MKLTKRFFRPFLSASLLTLIGVPSLFAAVTVPLSTVSNGQHSYRQLGNDFIVPLPMEKIEGAKLRILNREAFESLGIFLPANANEVETLILEAFAHGVKKPNSTAPTSKNLFASFYQDSSSKGPGEARGDGRAMWFGEVKIRQDDGTDAKVDILAKGGFQTPLAWTNHSRETHRDGLVFRTEGPHDYLMSEAAYQNGLETNRTLAVIEIPNLKYDDKAKRYSKAVIIVRTGPQFRLAHFRYYADQPALFQKLATYLIPRALRLPSESPVGPVEIRKYLTLVAENLGRQYALYQLQNAVQRNMTPGNITYTGGAIDMGTFRFLDANHPGYPILGSKLSDHRQNFLDDLELFLEYFKDGGMLTAESDDEAGYFGSFEKTYQLTYRHGVLQRMGLSDVDIQKVPSDVQTSVAKAFRNLSELKSDVKHLIRNESVVMAKLDMRSIYAHLWDFSPSTTERQESLVRFLMVKTRPWHHTSRQSAGKIANLITSQLQAVLKATGNPTPPPEWKTRAYGLSSKRRFDAESFALEAPIMEAMDSNKSWVEVTEIANRSVARLVDPGLAPMQESAFGNISVLERNLNSQTGPHPQFPACRELLSPRELSSH